MARNRHESRSSHCWTRPNHLEHQEGSMQETLLAAPGIDVCFWQKGNSSVLMRGWEAKLVAATKQAKAVPTLRPRSQTRPVGYAHTEQQRMDGPASAGSRAIRTCIRQWTALSGPVARGGTGCTALQCKDRCDPRTPHWGCSRNAQVGGDTSGLPAGKVTRAPSLVGCPVGWVTPVRGG